jgi:hypothetical protein
MDPQLKDNLIAFLYLCCGLIGVVAVLSLIPETIEISGHGIVIKKWRKTKEAKWQDIVEVRSKRAISGIRAAIAAGSPRYEPAITIKSQKWKHTLTKWKYGSDNLKNVFVSIAERVIPLGAEVGDELGWLPRYLHPRRRVHMHLREYKLLYKVGLLMLPVGLVLAGIQAVFNLNFHINLVIRVFLVIGGMCLLVGGLRYLDEKKKLNRERRKI